MLKPESRSLVISWETCYSTLYLGDFSQWFRVACLETWYLQEMDRTQPTLLWLFFCLSWARLSLMESCGRKEFVQEIEVALLSLYCCLEPTAVIGPVISHNSCFCIAMYLKTLSAKYFGEKKNMPIATPGSWGWLWNFLILKRSLVSKVEMREK